MLEKSVVARAEELGRHVMSSGQARRARRSVPHHVFLERPGTAEISVDRLTTVQPDEALANAEGLAAQRGRTFYGWAVLSAEAACRSGRHVRASPTKGNAAHADIVLPDLAAEKRDEQIRHARELADESHWRGRTERASAPSAG